MIIVVFLISFQTIKIKQIYYDITVGPASTSFTHIRCCRRIRFANLY